jgi:hypothetical protein
MPDVIKLQAQVAALSNAYRSVAAAVLARAQAMQQAGSISPQDFAQAKQSYSDLISSASDIVASFDDAQADSLAQSIAGVQAATNNLKDAQQKIDAVTTIADVAASLVSAAAAVVAFVTAPSPATTGAAVTAITGSVGKITGGGAG